MHLWKDFVRYASLSMLGMLGLSCYILADTFFVAQGVGETGLAALNLAIPAYNLMNGAALMLGMGGAIRYSVYRAKGEQDKADAAFTNTMLLAAIFSVIFMLAGGLGSGLFARLLGADEQTFALTDVYLFVLWLFSPAFLFSTSLMCFVRNDGAPATAMLATLSGSLANVLLDYVLIFPCGMGMLGAVLATGCSPLFGLAFCVGHILRGKNGFHLRPRTLSARFIAPVFSLGFPFFVEQLSSAVVIITFNYLFLGLSGNTGVAAYGVVANVSLVVLSLFNGIAQGAQPLFSRARGSKNAAQSRAVLRYALLSAFALSAVLYAVLFIFAVPVSDFFNSEHSQALREIAVRGLRLYFIAMPFAAVNILLCSYFSAEERALPAQIVSLLRGLIVILPAAFLLCALWAETGVWLAFPVTEAIVCAVAAGFLAFSARSARKKGEERTNF